MNANTTYKDLIVWQKAIQLVVAMYALTEKFPKEELFGLTSQMRRAAVSIPSNIAEGKMRGGDVEFKRFLSIAFASAAELETQLVISQEIFKAKNFDYTKINLLLTEIMKMLNKLTQKTKA